jgi:ABC-type sugar transport system ATPase subunit
MNRTVLEMRQIRKSYSGVTVLRDVDLTLEEGQIIGLVGENGAGKSTLMKILSGGIQPDSGEILIDGKKVVVSSPIVARQLHIAMVQQELSLIPTLSVTENIVLGREQTSGLFKVFNKQANNEYAKRALATMSLDFKLDERVGRLSVANQQLIEIARCLISNPRVLILDEPTTALTIVEAESLLKRMEELRDRGTSIIFISHKLEEIIRVSDKMIVMRDGAKVGEVFEGEVQRPELINLMVGNKQFFQREHRSLAQIKALPMVMQVKDLQSAGQFQDISFDVHKGEVFGFFGLKGAGRSELLMAIFGAEKIDSGEIVLDGVHGVPKNPYDAIRKGIGFVSEDRKLSGIMPTMDIKNNTMLSNYQKISSRIGVINEGTLTDTCEEYVKKLDIKIVSHRQRVNRLSGGNQQKVMIARWLHTNSKILVFDEPTKGVDVGAKQDIYLQINKLAQEGKAVVVISSELEEVMLLCDRVAVMREGQILRILDGEDINANTIMHYAAG